MSENGNPKHKETARRQNWQLLLLTVMSSLNIFCTSKVKQLSRYNDSLRSARSGDRISVRAIIYARIQRSSGAHLASSKMCFGSISDPFRIPFGSLSDPFPGGKVAGSWRRPGHPRLVLRLKKEHDLTSIFPLLFHGRYRVKFLTLQSKYLYIAPACSCWLLNQSYIQARYYHLWV